MTAWKLNVEQREQLFEDHKHLIPKLAKKFFKYGKIGVEYEDLLQEAGLGLHIATLEYKPERGKNQGFEKYAVTRMYQSMIRNFCKQNLLSTPVYIIETANKIKKGKLLEWEPAKIAKELDTRVSFVEGALKYLKGTPSFSLDAEIVGDNKRPISELIPDENNVCVVDHVTVQMFLDTLKGKEKQVFEMMALQDQRQKEIAQITGMSSQSVSVYAISARKKFVEYSRVV